MSHEAPQSFGDLLKLFRQDSGLTQQQLAKASGYSQPLISFLETGRRLPANINSIQIMSDVMALDPSSRTRLMLASGYLIPSPDSQSSEHISDRLFTEIKTLLRSYPDSEEYIIQDLLVLIRSWRMFLLLRKQVEIGILSKDAAIKRLRHLDNKLTDDNALIRNVKSLIDYLARNG